MKRLLGDGLGQRAGLSAVPTKNDDARVVVLHGSHDQGAKSLELRAIMSLSGLWQKQGKKAEARQMLREIYNWFTEGFDTADLKEAKELLKRFGARPSHIE